MLASIEQQRKRISRTTDASKKSRLGQFLTPRSTAEFMASLFHCGEGDCRLLDAGAGIGSLSAAFLERWRNGGFDFCDVLLDAYELDPDLIEHLSSTLASYDRCGDLSVRVHKADYILAAVEALSGDLFSQAGARYTHAILNPPYKKISSESAHRLALRKVGIETVNLYSGFVALAVAQAAPGGQIVAIIPRSFCNGPYYRPFREFILARAAIRHIHLFESRNTAFKDDDVLQENVIIHLERDAAQGPVTITTSADDRFLDLGRHEHSFERIVFPDDRERFIHVPSSPDQDAIERHPSVCYTLDELGIKVSTGPVVDFRLKEHLREMPEVRAVPLLYPQHCAWPGVSWPVLGAKKPNAIMCNPDTERWLYPNGFYCVVRRFSSKEEPRRIVATVIAPDAFDGHASLGFENHLNVFHEGRRGLPEALARGLAVFLNTTAVDEHFRRFNGHTQVNATDLRLIKYPSRQALIRLGEWAKQSGQLTQDMLDEQLHGLLA